MYILYSLEDINVLCCELKELKSSAPILENKNYNLNKAISMMRGKSPPSEFILEIIKSNNSLRFLKEVGKGDNFYFCQNIILFYFFTFILIKRAKLSIIGLFISITLKFAIFIP